MKQVLCVNKARKNQNKQGVEHYKAQLKDHNAALEEDVERRLEGKIEWINLKQKTILNFGIQKQQSTQLWMQKTGYRDGNEQDIFNGLLMDKRTGHGRLFSGRSNRTQILAKLLKSIKCSDKVQKS